MLVLPVFTGDFMDKRVENITSIDLSSMVNSHEKPFVVIDKNYRIMAVNKAYEQHYGATSENAVGQRCYQISHGKDHPCSDDGEGCPHEHIFNTGEATTCAHIHCDSEHHMQQVKVSAFPLKGSNNELFLGECIEEVPADIKTRCGTDRMVGESAEFTACIDQLNIAAGSDAPVLLQGETGTGKELAAEYIHKQSPRKMKPFQIVDSTVLTENLFESEMFGHVSGAFTGSVGDKQGLFELAEGGTIFLDEIGDMPISQQAKLLRVLESGQYRRVGGKGMRKANVRIICATNRHLWEAVIAGTFREDLYYRIACLNIRLPSLRERINDIPVLARSLIEDINRTMRCSYHLMPDVFEGLRDYQYPGNVRELRNILFIAATHSRNREIDAALIKNVLNNLPHCNEVGANEIGQVSQEPPLTTGLSHGREEAVSLKSIEEKHIRNLLERYKGNRRMVASALGISERTVYRKLKSLGIH
ncbi:MAG: Fis family transcriptional regulator [Gammaproteobacteria bacterium]|nr:MAG: Fis family transcriptional regulator [Gammaproteobacteria bacterium]